MAARTLAECWQQLETDSPQLLLTFVDEWNDLSQGTGFLSDWPTEPVLWSRGRSLCLTQTQLEWAWLFYFASRQAHLSVSTEELARHAQTLGLGEWFLAPDPLGLAEVKTPAPAAGASERKVPLPALTLALNAPREVRLGWAQLIGLKKALRSDPNGYAIELRERGLDASLLQPPGPLRRILRNLHTKLKGARTTNELEGRARLILQQWEVDGPPRVADPIAAFVARKLSEYQAWDDYLSREDAERWAFVDALLRPQRPTDPLQNADLALPFGLGPDEERLADTFATMLQPLAPRATAPPPPRHNTVQAVATVRQALRCQQQAPHAAPLSLPDLRVAACADPATPGPFLELPPLPVRVAERGRGAPVWQTRAAWDDLAEDYVNILTYVCDVYTRAVKVPPKKTLALVLGRTDTLPNRAGSLSHDTQAGTLYVYVNVKTYPDLAHQLWIALASDTQRAHWEGRPDALQRWFTKAEEGITAEGLLARLKDDRLPRALPKLALPVPPAVDSQEQ